MYVSPGALKEELPFDWRDFPVQSESEFDAAVERALTAASAMVDSWGDTAYELTETEATFSRPAHAPEHDLPLPKRPVVSVQSVEIDGETVAASDYYVAETHIELLESADRDEWPTDRRSITVAWTYGFETVPAPVERAVIRLARNALDQIETDGINTEESWQYRPPRKIKIECARMVGPHEAPSYYGGATIV